MAEISSRNGFLQKSDLDELRSRIDNAEIGDVQRCLDEVNTYNECFLALPCSVFEENAVPAWLAGVNAAPCACGVVDAPFGGPLPPTLAGCVGLLPVRSAPARPGFACPQ